jgi:hypothetical protein
MYTKAKEELYDILGAFGNSKTNTLNRNNQQ